MPEWKFIRHEHGAGLRGFGHDVLDLRGTADQGMGGSAFFGPGIQRRGLLITRTAQPSEDSRPSPARDEAFL
jgi:hypothetical protein